MEIETEDAPKTRAVRPKGRPKKDSIPPEAANAKAFPQAPRALEKGGIVSFERFWAYRKSLAPEFLERITFYVNREWPKCDVRKHLTEQDLQDIKDHKKQKPVKYIGQYADIDPDNWRNQLLRYHGSGDYKIYLNDTGVRGNPKLKSINVCRTFVSLRDDEFPPVIEDLSILDLDDPINKGYILQLKSKGTVIPGDTSSQEENDDMAAIQLSAVETLTSALVESTKSNKAPSDNGTSAVLQDMLKASEARHAEDRRVTEERHQRELDALTKRMEANEKESKERGRDPLETTKAVIEMARSVTQAATPPPAQDNKMVDVLMQMLKDNNERALQDRKLDAERHTREMDALNKRLEAQEAREIAARAAQQTPAGNGASGAVKDVLSVLKAVGDLKGGMDSLGGGAAQDGPWWLEPVVEGSTKLLDLAAAVFIPKPGAAPVPQQQPAAVSQAAPAIQQAPQQSGDPQVNMMLNMMKVPILDALRQGVPGHVFAAQIVARYGEEAYRMASGKGEAGLFQILQSDSAFWGQLLQIGAGPVQAFVTAFLNEQAVSEALQAIAAQQQQRPMTPPPAGRPANQPRPATVVDATPSSGGRTIITGDGTKVQTKANGAPSTDAVA